MATAKAKEPEKAPADPHKGVPPPTARGRGRAVRCAGACPEVETVAIMIAEKSFRHLEGHGNGKHGCEVQHRVACHVLLVH